MNEQQEEVSCIDLRDCFKAFRSPNGAFKMMSQYLHHIFEITDIDDNDYQNNVESYVDKSNNEEEDEDEDEEEEEEEIPDDDNKLSSDFINRTLIFEKFQRFTEFQNFCEEILIKKDKKLINDYDFDETSIEQLGEIPSFKEEPITDIDNLEKLIARLEKETQSFFDFIDDEFGSLKLYFKDIDENSPKKLIFMKNFFDSFERLQEPAEHLVNQGHSLISKNKEFKVERHKSEKYQNKAIMKVIFDE
ncbi:hypothetical protein TRFO_19698 [Tritrichomonas foetus]|uniref:Uncharacterized protein n=1 Tax=Tritrichomonas foetus TaxID=1144522 RepID=A0A1J4KM75_9EUKA|nr:hypothetical protein TRFO_19698 [Tritrichomonas foetus]|eukprot:OHT10900.1 hypothetical protein TRFO_19698 [Tritrichomonas foetus]